MNTAAETRTKMQGMSRKELEGFIEMTLHESPKNLQEIIQASLDEYIKESEECVTHDMAKAHTTCVHGYLDTGELVRIHVKKLNGER